MSVPGAEEKYLTESWDAAPFCSTKQKKKFQQNGAAYSRELPAINRKRRFRVKRVSSQPEITSFIWSFKSIWISLLQTGAWAIRPSFKTQNITVINCWSFSSFAFSPLNQTQTPQENSSSFSYFLCFNKFMNFMVEKVKKKYTMRCERMGWNGLQYIYDWSYAMLISKYWQKGIIWNIDLEGSTKKVNKSVAYLLDNFYPFCLF
jgi:hypothetical protein